MQLREEYSFGQANPYSYCNKSSSTIVPQLRKCLKFEAVWRGGGGGGEIN